MMTRPPIPTFFMDDPEAARLTQLLQRWQQGDTDAGAALVPLVYNELRRLAAIKLHGERPGHTLQPTALVHEAWMRLAAQHGSGWRNREQFFALAAQAMRRILVDHARRRLAAKRGAGVSTVQADDLADVLVAPAADERLVALDGALERLAVLDARQAKLVELRFFAGLSVDETGQVLGLSPTTIKREWATARAWLFHAIEADSG
jgi:RNA polymerase sigma factor (TIGR02999 family)